MSTFIYIHISYIYIYIYIYVYITRCTYSTQQRARVRERERHRQKQRVGEREDKSEPKSDSESETECARARDDGWEIVGKREGNSKKSHASYTHVRARVRALSYTHTHTHRRVIHTRPRARACTILHTNTHSQTREAPPHPQQTDRQRDRHIRCTRKLDASKEHAPLNAFLYDWYGVATISRLLKILGLFCRISSFLQGSFAKETYNFKAPTHRSHPIPICTIGSLEKVSCPS